MENVMREAFSNKFVLSLFSVTQKMNVCMCILAWEK